MSKIYAGHNEIDFNNNTTKYFANGNIVLTIIDAPEFMAQKIQEAIDKIKLETEDEKKCDKKISKIKDKEVEELIFAKYLRDTNNAKSGNQSVAKFFTVKK
jgi:hypothetical protein